ncbi:prephenate dehydratase [Desulfitobacterium sp.]|uniref:prephenate dehydratase n=1 Tax=Desulfitobacterium sp. TaxID=49981 RepID=UPI002B1EA1AE|nr:prephenate dehydratase [Desulfitobacterium sp.]MEA4901206.1 prephenate dehydratase [Desulfitobacterium sp.]
MSSIGYLGPKGSFSEEALQLFLSQPNEWKDECPHPIPFSTIPKLLLACDRHEIDYGFVPLENSTEGQVGATLDTLGQTENIYVFKEFIHPIEQCLLTPQPLELTEIERVYSHQQALGQCRDFLETHLPQADQIVCLSSAEAAQKVSSAHEKWAAIGTHRAAGLYSLHCQMEGIQDAMLNATRFILVSHSLAEMSMESSAEDKTSLLIIAPNIPGSLSQILQEFAIRNINMSRIESRPSKKKLGEYVFYIDIDGYVFSPIIQEALWALREKHVSTKLLGSYPKAVSQISTP